MSAVTKLRPLPRGLAPGCPPGVRVGVCRLRRAQHLRAISLIRRPFAPSGAADQDHSQMFGDVWEWTSSSYGPYPGYAPLPGVLGEYNGKFMSSQWVLLRRFMRHACKITFAASYRNFFYPKDVRGSSAGFAWPVIHEYVRQSARGIGSPSADRRRGTEEVCAGLKKRHKSSVTQVLLR